jgi:hypothetical protein
VQGSGIFDGAGVHGGKSQDFGHQRFLNQNKNAKIKPHGRQTKRYKKRSLQEACLKWSSRRRKKEGRVGVDISTCRVWMRVPDWLPAGWMASIPPLIGQSKPGDSKPRGIRTRTSIHQNGTEASASGRRGVRVGGLP